VNWIAFALCLQAIRRLCTWPSAPLFSWAEVATKFVEKAVFRTKSGYRSICRGACFLLQAGLFFPMLPMRVALCLMLLSWDKLTLGRVVLLIGQCQLGG